MSAPHAAFVLEQTLGHVTHGNNLQSLIPADPRIESSFLPVEFGIDGLLNRLPAYSNWTVRAGLRARRSIRSTHRRRRIDALFVHTQVPAVLNADLVGRIPTVVSIDATPRQYDELGVHYAHETGGERVEAWKWKLNRRCFQRAAALVTWSDWAKAGLAREYEVDTNRIIVIPPGVDPQLWARTETPSAAPGDHPVRILFVGGDFERKGGNDLIAAYRELRRRTPTAADVELHLVTPADVPAEPGVIVHHSLTPNSVELIDLYHSAHVFCLPTHGDCLPMVLSEAGAAGLPIVSTDVGAIGEIVRDGVTGWLVRPGDVPGLVERLLRLVDDRALAHGLGKAAAAHVAAHYDAERNARRVVDVLLDVHDQPRARRRRDRRGSTIETASGRMYRLSS